MKPLRLNIATQRRLRRNVLFPVMLILLLATAGLIFGSFRLISRYFHHTTQMETKLKQQKETLERLEREGKEAERQINQKKTEWDPRIKYCNQLIEQKLFSFSQRLSFLEAHVPAEISLESIVVKNGSTDIAINALSPDFIHTTNFYRVLSPFKFNLISETPSEQGVSLIVFSIQYLEKE